MEDYVIWRSFRAAARMPDCGNQILWSLSCHIDRPCERRGDATGAFDGGINSFASGGNTIITKSTIAGNSAELDGGGIYAHGATVIDDSTLSGNSALAGGAVWVETGTTSITNSTLTGNTAEFFGGGVFVLGTLTMQHSTIAANTARFDGGWRTTI